jgi:hypothetical protein
MTGHEIEQHLQELGGLISKLGFVSNKYRSSVDSFVLRNRQLLVAAKR